MRDECEHAVLAVSVCGLKRSSGRPGRGGRAVGTRTVV